MLGNHTPCPWCGCRNSVLRIGLTSHIRCESCGARGPEKQTIHEAVESWESRDNIAHRTYRLVLAIGVVIVAAVVWGACR